jgi:hypothetical protein
VISWGVGCGDGGGLGGDSSWGAGYGVSFFSLVLLGENTPRGLQVPCAAPPRARGSCHKGGSQAWFGFESASLVLSPNCQGHGRLVRPGCFRSPVLLRLKRAWRLQRLAVAVARRGRLGCVSKGRLVRAAGARPLRDASTAATSPLISDWVSRCWRRHYLPCRPRHRGPRGPSSS